MKKIFTLLFVGLMALTACSAKVDPLTSKGFTSAFNAAKTEARRFVVGDTAEEIGQNFKMELSHFYKANGVDASKEKEVVAYFGEFTKEIISTLDSIELTESQDTKRHIGKMIYRVDVNIDQAYIVFEDLTVMITDGDAFKNYTIKTEDLAKFDALKANLAAKVEELVK